MKCFRYCHSENGVYSEWCELTLDTFEIHPVIRALQYYTDKRKLPFEERMMIGDMARRISELEPEEV